MKIKKSEARLLVFLEKVRVNLRYARAISSKLDIGYSFCCEILAKMVYKRWLRTEQFTTKKYYFLNKKAPIKEAKRCLK